MMSHSARVETIATQLRSFVLVSDWPSITLPRIGTVRIHVMPQESCKAYGWNEVWARIDSHEFRGSAEKVAAELCKLLKAPSKAVGATAQALMSKRFDGLRAPEMAAAFGLDEEAVFRALDFLAEQGLAVSKGDPGWFKVQP